MCPSVGKKYSDKPLRLCACATKVASIDQSQLHNAASPSHQLIASDIVRERIFRRRGKSHAGIG